jgi:exodeoxyribonuclease-3
MKIVSWNINGIKARQPYLELFLDTHLPDVLCIQELKSETDKVPAEIFTSRGYEVAIHGQKSWNGVMIASKYPISDVVMGLPDNGHEDESRLIAATIEGRTIVNLYCPQGQTADSEKFAFKKRFYDRLIQWVSDTFSTSDSLILTGDFNIAPYPEDVYDPTFWEGRPTRHPEELERWSRLLEWGLTDVGESHIGKGTYSFWDYRGMAFRFNNGLRIDHFLGTESIADQVDSAAVIRDFRRKKDGLKASDHAPVELLLK